MNDLTDALDRWDEIGNADPDNTLLLVDAARRVANPNREAVLYELFMAFYWQADDAPDEAWAREREGIELHVGHIADAVIAAALTLEGTP